MSEESKYQDQESKLNTIMYVLAISEASYRQAKGFAPFDMQDPSCIELIFNRSIYFIEAGENAKIPEAHNSFLDLMLESGWKFGEENLEARTHPYIVPYDQLSNEQKDYYVFIAAIVMSAVDFYENFRVETESSLMDDLASLPVAKNSVQ